MRPEEKKVTRNSLIPFAFSGRRADKSQSRPAAEGGF